MTTSTERSWITFLRTRRPDSVRRERFLPSLGQARCDRYDRETDRLRVLLARTK